MPTMHDRAMQALYLLALDPVAECHADPNSYGFRKERSTADAIEQCHTVLSNRGGAQWVLEGDIKACFERICHSWLVANVPMDKAILQKWLKAGYIEWTILHPTDAGTPQGGIITPPTMLQNAPIGALHKRVRTYPEHHVDLICPYFYSLHQCSYQLAPHHPVCLRQPIPDLRGKRL